MLVLRVLLWAAFALVVLCVQPARQRSTCAAIDTSFTETLLTSADGPVEPVIADLDGDGHEDIIVAVEHDNEVLWFKNDGSDTRFIERSITAELDRPRSVHAIDVDGDADLDVLVAAWADDAVVWLENDGSQLFNTMHVLTTEADAAVRVVGIDLDRDGDVDVLAASYNDNTLRWFENVGGGHTFAEHTITSDAQGAWAFHVSDIDRDSDLDVVLVSRLDHTVKWFENDGTLNFTTQHNLSTTPGQDPTTVVAVDLDADADVDILVANCGTDTVVWFENNGSENFATEHVLVSADCPHNFVVADVEGDGDLDLVVSSWADDTIQWLENDGSQSFAWHAITDSINCANRLAVSDLNGDGLPDVALASYCDDTIALLSSWHSEFEEHEVVASVSFLRRITVGDLDSDGDSDLIVASMDGDDSIIWLENDVGTTASPGFIAEHQLSASPSGPWWVDAVDIDGDGDVDVLCASHIDDSVYWFENNGSAAFTKEHVLTSSANGAAFVIGSDIDGDGDVDVLAAAWYGDTVAWFENDGSQNFTEHEVTTEVDYPYTAFPSDMDGDGDLDVVTASRYDDKVAWFENDGTQHFTNEHVITTTADGAVFALPVDLDLDGDVDVVAASLDGDSIRWFEQVDGSGGGEFLNHFLTSALNGAYSVSAADVDADGDLDVLALAYYHHTVALFRNDGTQQFEKEDLSLAARWSRHGTFADLNNDGAMDIVAAPSARVLWYEHRNWTSSAPTPESTAAPSASPAPSVSPEPTPSPTLALCGAPNASHWTVSTLHFDVQNVAGGDMVQLAEFQVYDSAGSDLLQHCGVTVTNPGGSGGGGASAEYIVDGNHTTSWSDANLSTLVFEFDHPVVPVAFSWTTAASAASSSRDPTQWQLLGFPTNELGDALVLHDAYSTASAKAFSSIAERSTQVDVFGTVPSIVTAVAAAEFSYSSVPGASSFCRLRSPQMCSGDTKRFLAVDSTTSPFRTIDVGSYAVPQFVDLNGDDLHDLVLGAADGTLTTFYNEGTKKTPALILAARTRGGDPFGAIDVGERAKPSFADFDADGDLDLLVGEEHCSNAQYWTNVGNLTHPRFKRAADNPFSVLGVLDDLGANCAAEAVDLDADGDHDVVAGVNYNEPGLGAGQFFFFESVNATHPDLHYRSGVNSPMHVSADNYLRTGSMQVEPTFVDLDGDGDLDLVSGKRSGELVMFWNRGSATNPIFSRGRGLEGAFRDIGWAIENNSPYTAFADVDGDGDDDMAVGLADGTVDFYEQVGALHKPNFEYVPMAANPLNRIDVGFQAVPSFADLDGDGDLDLASPGYHSSHLYLQNAENLGSPSEAIFDEEVQESVLHLGLSSSLARPAAGAWVDKDADGDPDYVVGHGGGNLILLENVGSPTSPSFSEVSAPDSGLQDIDFGCFISPQFVDLDADGDFDLCAGGCNGTLHYWENTGSAASWTFQARSEDANPFKDIDVGSNARAAFLDLDYDGDKDLLTGSLEGEVLYFVNEGTAAAPNFSSVQSDKDYYFDVVSAASAPAVADLDADGDEDLVIGDGFGVFLLFANGRCIPQFPCSSNGGCVDDRYFPNCTCFSGWTGDQCNDCLSGFWGSSCDLCPGAGTVQAPDLTNVCSQQGVCADGIKGAGNCSCNAPFYGDACEYGSCPGGSERMLNTGSGLFECQLCAQGAFRADNASSDPDTCEECAVGYFASTEGSTACDACPVGKFSSATGATECSECLPGYFSAQNASVACTACDTSAGATSSVAGSASCDGCVKGYFLDHTTVPPTCTKCQDGMHCSEQLLQLQSLPLREGYWRIHGDSVQILSCALSDACVGGNGTADELCDTGHEGAMCSVCSKHYYYSKGANTCKPCGSAAAAPVTIIVLTLLVVAISLVGCHLLVAADSMSVDAVAGLVSERVRSVTLEIRRRRSSAVSDESSIPASVAIPEKNMPPGELGVGQQAETKDGLAPSEAGAPTGCQQPLAGGSTTKNSHSAVKGTASVNDEADANSNTKLQVIRRGVSPTAANADADPDSDSDGAAASADADADATAADENGDSGGRGGGGGRDSGGTKMDGRQNPSSKNRWSTKLKILTTTSQIFAGLPWALDLDFPQVFGSYLDVLSFANLDFVQVLPLDCIRRSDHVDEMLWMTLLPLAVGGLLLLLLTAHTRWVHWRATREHTLSDGVRLRVLDKSAHSALEEEEMALKSRYYGAVLLISFMVFPSVSSKIFHTFSCQTLDGQSYLRADYSINCGGARYQWARLYAVAMVFVYPLGIPAAYFFVLSRKRFLLNAVVDEPLLHCARSLYQEHGGSISSAAALQMAKMEFRDQQTELRPFSFLYDSYEPRMWAWEVYECARRLVLSGLLIFFLEGTATQIVIAILISLASIEIVERFKPYVEGDENMLASVCSWEIFFVLLGALLLRVDVTPDDKQGQDTFGVLLLLITFFAPALAIASVSADLGGRSLREWWRNKTGASGDSDDEDAAADDSDDTDEFDEAVDEEALQHHGWRPKRSVLRAMSTFRQPVAPSKV